MYSYGPYWSIGEEIFQLLIRGRIGADRSGQEIQTIHAVRGCRQPSASNRPYVRPSLGGRANAAHRAVRRIRNKRTTRTSTIGMGMGEAGIPADRPDTDRARQIRRDSPSSASAASAPAPQGAFRRVVRPAGLKSYKPVILSANSGSRAPCTVVLDVAASISFRSTAVSSTATAPRFSSRR